MKRLIGVLLFLCYVLHGTITISPELKKKIGMAIWRNECAGKVDGLTVWNKGENFPSFGIGHFIWLPKNCSDTFVQTFPDLMHYIATERSLPAWLQKQLVIGAPWTDRDTFLKAIPGDELTQLRAFLANTVDLQVSFIIKRLRDALPQMLKVVPGPQQALIKKRFDTLAQMASGIYALADYVNFKGLGTKKCESYGAVQWGLVHVLQAMSDDQIDAVKAFVQAAKKILQQRVTCAPVERNEQRWLPGWFSRLDTYTSFS